MQQQQQPDSCVCGWMQREEKGVCSGGKCIHSTPVVVVQQPRFELAAAAAANFSDGRTPPSLMMQQLLLQSENGRPLAKRTYFGCGLLTQRRHREIPEDQNDKQLYECPLDLDSLDASEGRRKDISSPDSSHRRP